MRKLRLREMLNNFPKVTQLGFQEKPAAYCIFKVRSTPNNGTSRLLITSELMVLFCFVLFYHLHSCFLITC